MPETSQASRIAVRCGHRMNGHALARWLDAQPEYTVVGVVESERHLVRLCALRAPDIAVLQTASGEFAELELVRRLRSQFPGLYLLGLHHMFDPAALLALHRAGLHRTVSLHCDLAVLRAALDELRQRGCCAGGRPGLTERELEVLALVCAGCSVNEIGTVLGISPYTVANFKRRIFAKMDVQSRTQAAAVASDLGLLRDDSPLPRRDTSLSLTQREREILASIARGESVRQTGNALGIAVKTVQSVQRQLFFKLGASNRASAIGRARELGLVDGTLVGGVPLPD